MYWASGLFPIRIRIALFSERLRFLIQLAEDTDELIVELFSFTSRVTSSPCWVAPLSHHCGFKRPRRLPKSPGDCQVPQSISLIKGTSLASTCGIIEITYQNQILAGRDYRYLEGYVALAIIYWVITIILERIFKVIEKKVKIPEQPKAIEEK